MRSIAFGALAVAGAALFLTLAPSPRPEARAADPPGAGPSWEPGDATAWADADEAERHSALDDEARRVAARAAEKQALVDALLRGERTLAVVAGRFRALNAAARNPYVSLAAEHRGAGEEELAYRQVLRYAGAPSARRTAAAAVLPALEAEVARRFPPPTAAAGIPAA